MKKIFKILLSTITTALAANTVIACADPQQKTVVLNSPNLMLTDFSQTIKSNQQINHNQLKAMLQKALMRSDHTYLTANQIKNIDFQFSHQQQTQLLASQNGTAPAVPITVTTGNEHFQVRVEMNINPIHYQHFIVFGDSLSDIGELSNIIKFKTGFLPAGHPKTGFSGLFYKHRSFSDGPVAVEDLNQMPDLPPMVAAPDNPQSAIKNNYDLNYATAGATITPWADDKLMIQMMIDGHNSEQQIHAYEAALQDKNAQSYWQNTLGIYEFGANDFWFNPQLSAAVQNPSSVDSKTLTQEIEQTMITPMKNSIKEIFQKAKIKSLIVTNVPNLGQEPGIPHITGASPEGLALISPLYNRLWSEAINELQKTYPQLIKIDLVHYFNLIKAKFPWQENTNNIATKAFFNIFTDQLDSIRTQASIGQPLSHFMYFDGMHSGSWANYVAANYLYNDLYGWHWNSTSENADY